MLIFFSLCSPLYIKWNWNLIMYAIRAHRDDILTRMNTAEVEKVNHALFNEIWIFIFCSWLMCVFFVYNEVIIVVINFYQETLTKTRFFFQNFQNLRWKMTEVLWSDVLHVGLNSWFRSIIGNYFWGKMKATKC